MRVVKNLILEQFFYKIFISPESLEINVVISQNVFLFKVVQSFRGSLLLMELKTV